MARIEGDCRKVFEATEFVTLVTQGDDGPRVVAGNWAPLRKLWGIQEDTIIRRGTMCKPSAICAGTAAYSCSSPPGRCREPAGPGRGTSSPAPPKYLESGEVVAAVKAQFPWARGALVIHVEEVTAQL